ncbi:MAG: hypothetical protein Q9160_000779 [Pyrenula sp. 1 TL-2023]
MHLTTSTTSSLLLLLSPLTSLTSAHPSPTLLPPRACSTLGPNTINILEKGDPTHPHPGQIFNLARGSTGPSTSANDFTSVVSFSYIPSSATGCQLIWQYPGYSYPGIPFATGPATQADVWLVEPPDPTATSTWNGPPRRDQFVATLRFPTERKQGDQPFKTTLWSGTCGRAVGADGGLSLSFLFEYSDWQQGGGSVRFYNTLGGKQGLEPLGFSIVFSC